VTATLGVTGHCLFGRHKRCPYRPGGSCHGGIASSAAGGRYDCPCECHTVVPFGVQLDLFEAQPTTELEVLAHG
jgi:hypothetical protein